MLHVCKLCIASPAVFLLHADELHKGFYLLHNLFLLAWRPATISSVKRVNTYLFANIALCFHWSISFLSLVQLRAWHPLHRVLAAFIWHSPWVILWWADDFTVIIFWGFWRFSCKIYIQLANLIKRFRTVHMTEKPNRWFLDDLCYYFY